MRGEYASTGKLRRRSCHIFNCPPTMVMLPISRLDRSLRCYLETILQLVRPPRPHYYSHSAKAPSISGPAKSSSTTYKHYGYRRCPMGLLYQQADRRRKDYQSRHRRSPACFDSYNVRPTNYRHYMAESTRRGRCLEIQQRSYWTLSRQAVCPSRETRSRGLDYAAFGHCDSVYFCCCLRVEGDEG